MWLGISRAKGMIIMRIKAVILHCLGDIRVEPVDKPKPISFLLFSASDATQVNGRLNAKEKARKRDALFFLSTIM